jgi:hypothetical protein
MIIRNKSNRYTVIPNHLLEDERITWEAKGILSYLLSKPDTWELSAKHLIGFGHAGKEKIYRVLKELQKAGYASHSRRGDGRVEWEIRDTPISENPNPENQYEANPHPEKPYQEKPYQANPDVLINTESRVNTDSREKIFLSRTHAHVASPVPKSPPPEELVPDEKTKIHALKKFIPEGRIPEIVEDFLDWHRANGVYRADYQAELRRWMTRWKIENPATTWNSKPGSALKNTNKRGNYEANRPFGQRKLSAAERQLELQREFERLHRDDELNIIDITRQCARVN